MAKRLSISLRGESDSITEPVTKFGGQPVWVEAPEWPLSRQTGRQMQFVCQIALAPEIFGGEPGRMAYLFMTGEDEREWVDGAYDPGGGENAVVVQPGDDVTVKTGPALYRFADDEDRRSMVACEYVVENERLDWSDEEFDAYERLLDGNKVGGTPGFIQGDEFPEGGPWRLLLQLDSAAVPFYINFGDMGIGYAYLSEDGRSGRFLWQCY